MELAQELQKARAITEDLVLSSPKTKSPPEYWRLVRSNTFGILPGEHGRNVSTSGGSFFDPAFHSRTSSSATRLSHTRFPSDSTTSTAFFDFEENWDAENPDKTKMNRESLRIITTWPTRAITPPPLLSPFKENSDSAARGDDPLLTPNTKKVNLITSTAYSTQAPASPVLPTGADKVPLERTQGQSDTSPTRVSSYPPSSPFMEGLIVHDAPAIVVEHHDIGDKTLMEEPDLLAEEYRASGSIDGAQAPGNATTSYGFPTSSATALGLSPSIYLSPIHEAQLSDNSLELARIIRPEVERNLSTPSFISGVLQAGLLLEKLERENTASFEEDAEAVHLQVLTAVVDTGEQASSSSSLSHYSTEGSPKHLRPRLPSLTSAGTIYLTATDLSTAAQSLPPRDSHNAPCISYSQLQLAVTL
jgi:hypothetical protein